MSRTMREMNQRLHQARLRFAKRVDHVRVRMRERAGERGARARERLERALHFVLSASHDFKTPLAGIHASIRTLRTGWDRLSVAQREEILGRMQQQTWTLSRMLDNVLATARLTVGFAGRPIDLGDAVEASVREARMLVPEREIRIMGPQTPLTIHGDPVRLARVLGNLLDNALKYSGDATVVEVRVGSEAGEGLVAIRDHGIGMYPAEVRAVFRAYMRTSRALRSPNEGSGLGLFLTRSFVKDLGGRIEVISEPGVGSTFTVHLPLSDRRDNLAE